MKAFLDGLIQVAIGVAILAVLFPFGLVILRWTKRRRGLAMAAGSLLLLFGLNVQVSPPPPPVIEHVEEEEEAETGGEPKET